MIINVDCGLVTTCNFDCGIIAKSGLKALPLLLLQCIIVGFICTDLLPIPLKDAYLLNSYYKHLLNGLV